MKLAIRSVQFKPGAAAPAEVSPTCFARLLLPGLPDWSTARAARRLLASAMLAALVMPLFTSVSVLADDGTFQCGVRLFDCGRYPSAMKYFEAAAKEQPYDARVPYYEGLCQHRMGHIAAARSFYQQVVDKFPDSDAAEMAKKGLGNVDYGSGYDRPGGSLAKLDKLRMDVVPQSATINCQELNGKPVVVVSVDGKKISFIVDPGANNTFIGSDLVRSNALNDTPISAKQNKAGKGAGEGKTGKEAKETPSASTPDSKTAPAAKPPAEAKSPAENKDAAAPKSSKSAEEGRDQKTVTASHSPVGGKDGLSLTGIGAVNSRSARPEMLALTADSKASEAGASAADSKGGGANAAETKSAGEAKAAAEQKNSGEAKSAADAKPQSETNVTGKEESSKTVSASTPGATPKVLEEEKSSVDPISDANVILYDLIMGPVERPGFPVFITAKTLSLVRDHSYDDPFGGGMALLNKGKYAQAVPLLKRATVNRPADPRALYCYALALQKSGQIDIAKLAYRQVVIRFPNTEANFFAQAALSSIDPSYMTEMKLQKKDMQTKGPKKYDSPQFDLPYRMDGTWMVVTARVDGVPVEMQVDLWGNESIWGSNQLAAVSPDTLADLQEVGRVTDDSTNSLYTTVTKQGFIKRISIGNAEKLRMPIKVVDSGPLKYLASWVSTTTRPILPFKVFTDWRFQVMDDLKVVRFIKLGTGR